ncbi:hypothetical protein BJY01DRAFT_246857 [Aspergillus pseudoustus]|uniref:Ankyrin repeat-containing domain protein n=1 Tax=Aspergillus pseudoustus TaxID=1810923 RepID=A0ABR4K597_9EURO
MVRILLGAGADPAPKNDQDITAFHFAIWKSTVTNSNVDIPRCILECPAIHGLSKENAASEPLDYDGAIDALLKASWGREALAVDDRGNPVPEKNVNRVKDKVRG